MRECGNKHAPRTSVYTMSERSFEASEAGARSGIPRWSGNAGMRNARIREFVNARMGRGMNIQH